MAQSVERPASARVMISRFVSSSSVLTAQSLEPALDSVSPSLSVPPPLTIFLSLSQNKTLIIFNLCLVFKFFQLKKKFF